MLPGSSKKKEVTIKVEHHTSKSESPREEKLALKLKPNSLGEFSFRVPKEDIKLKLEVQIILEKLKFLRIYLFIRNYRSL